MSGEQGPPTKLRTETRNPRSERLGELTALEVVTLLTNEERAVLDAIEAAGPALAEAAERVAVVHEAGRRVFLLGAGTSGRLAVMEAAELPPTFGIAQDRFVPIIASGASGGPAAVTFREDDTTAVVEGLVARECGPDDAVIGIAASGTTPFVLAGLAHARSLGAWTCGIANNPGVPLLTEVDHPVLLDTGPEVLTGSTRLKAGTAQKLALNRITTAAMVRCGRVVGNLMVHVRPTTEKLRRRCIDIVVDLTGRDEASAVALLEQADWDIPAALASADHAGPS